LGGTDAQLHGCIEAAAAAAAAALVVVVVAAAALVVVVAAAAAAGRAYGQISENTSTLVLSTS
jgi:hypothetical protein